MFHSLIKPSLLNSFFLFGPRGSGKSTLLKQYFVTTNTLYIDLLEDRMESRYSRDPDLLISDIRALPNCDWVIVDEIQKLPKLLDIAHKLIEEKKIKFILTGSSARKLKRGGANLLAGRAFLYHLYPLSVLELKDRFELTEALHWGMLPKIFSLDNSDRKKFLTSYTKTYLKEEILQEQIVRNAEGFRNFLEIAAQMNGRVLNLSKIARECGIDAKTVKTFYSILEDTLIGFTLPAYHKSVRKSQSMQSKFFFFDLGVVRALEGSLDSPPVPRTAAYGQLFEQFMILEIFKLNDYFQKDFKLSHYRTSTGQEVDLILSKGGNAFAVEIKSTQQVDVTEAASFERISKGFGADRLYLVSQDPVRSKVGNVICIYWQDFLKEVFENTTSS